MEVNISRKRRAAELGDTDDDRDKVYRFKVLLPNGTTIELNLRAAKPEMPTREFISLVKDEHYQARRQSESMRQKKDINWQADSLFLVDANETRIANSLDFKNYKPHKCHILRLYDGSDRIADTFENMWDLTPETDLLQELPEDYTYETALADLIDNSLQAVWSNLKHERRLLKVEVTNEKITIFDTGPGMDGSDERSIVKWGKFGASLHRSLKVNAIGGDPPYLMPYFAMFGYGGPIASMHLGGYALVSSKTKNSKKVYTLRLQREALLNNSGQGWRTSGGLRDAQEDEIEEARHGSFTKVEIFEPKMKCADVFRLQCYLKDIYFPYIQCDELSDSGRTATPIEFQVNDINLTEVEGGEVAITNLQSSNGPNFVVQLHFYTVHNKGDGRGSGAAAHLKANARLKFVYFPVKEAKENIVRILERLKEEEYGIEEDFENFSRVSIRRLGRLLPDARWASLPVMDFKHRKGEKAHFLRRYGLRVKCFVETDAGFQPTPSKTDLAQHHPFTVALKNFGNKNAEKEKDTAIKIYRDGKLLLPPQLEKEYQDWILEMHDRYDEETDPGHDQPVIVVSPANKKALGVSSEVIRVHRVIKRKQTYWKRGQKIKVLRGACSASCKSNTFATIEYFLLEGLEGETGGEARMICRPMNTPDEFGCILSENDNNASLDVRGSLSIPISVIDEEKCVAVKSNEWEWQLDKKRQKATSKIDLLSGLEAKYTRASSSKGESLKYGKDTASFRPYPERFGFKIMSNICETLSFDNPIYAGDIPPIDIVAVVRPSNFSCSTSSAMLDQKYIVKCKSDMSMKVKFVDESRKLKNLGHEYSQRVAPSSYNGSQGLYVFRLDGKFRSLFRRAGVYMFSFSIEDANFDSCDKRMVVKPSAEVGGWKFLNNVNSSTLKVRVGSSNSSFPLLSIACFDIYDNRIPFPSKPKVMIRIHSEKGLHFVVSKLKAGLSGDMFTFEIKDALVECSELDKVRPNYDATLEVSSLDEFRPISIPCQVIPGPVQSAIVHPPELQNHLFPGHIVKELILEMFDEYGNHVSEGSLIALKLSGFTVHDDTGLMHKVNDHGRIDLSGLLKLTVGYGRKASLSVLCENEVVFKQDFEVLKRELRIASKLPSPCVAGGLLENITFEVVNVNGRIDESIHHGEEFGQLHMLMIKLGSSRKEQSISYYPFKQGRCIVPTINIPNDETMLRFEAAHSQHAELCLTVEAFLIKQGDNTMMSSVKGYQGELQRYALKIGKLEDKISLLNMEKIKAAQEASALEAALQPYLSSNTKSLDQKKELVKQIQGIDNAAAAAFCHLSVSASQLPQNSFMEDIVGLVALLGTVHMHKLSRILSEYLGKDEMLAVICRTFEAASAFENYIQNMDAHKKMDAHEKGANCQFVVMSLEDMRPFGGSCEVRPQRKLVLEDPMLPNGDNPDGFLGYAVNMVDLDIDHLQTRTASGHGLRETVLFNLFRKLHVYETKDQMLASRACIDNGAVSLDGWILRENGIISRGHGNPEISFPSKTGNESDIPPEALVLLMQIEEKKSLLRLIKAETEKATTDYAKCMKKFAKKNKKLEELLDNANPVDMMEPVVQGYLVDRNNSTLSKFQSPATSNVGVNGSAHFPQHEQLVKVKQEIV